MLLGYGNSAFVVSVRTLSAQLIGKLFLHDGPGTFALNIIKK
jgi:hypothetical protein